MSAKRVLLVSNGYPDAEAREKGFIVPDLQAFLAAGYDVAIAPIRPVRRLDPDLPGAVTVVHDLADMYRPWQVPVTLAKLLGAAFFWREARTAWRHGRCADLAHFLKESVRAMSMMRVARRQPYDVLYTYWFKGEASGIAFLPRDGSVRVTRTHGYDLYEDRPNNQGYIPYREQTLPLLDGIIFLSEEARSYIETRYPGLPVKTMISPLGVALELAQNPRPRPHIIQLASCSYAAANKRLPLIAGLAAALAEQSPSIQVKWTHFGCSRQQADLGAFREPANLLLEFQGEVPNAYIRDWYRQHAVSFFVNLSLSEGQPVSIMEAMACGIPVVATAVGGVPEMLSEGAGVLLPKFPDPHASAREILTMLNASERYRTMRDKALHTQRTYFNTTENGRRLAASIDELTRR